MKLVHKLLIGLVTGLVALSAASQDCSSRPIRIIIGFGAGGSSDAIARKVGHALSMETGQSVIVENKVGGNGIIAMNTVAKAAPDGCTLHFGTLQPTLVTHPIVYSKLPYDPEAFTPIALVADTPLALIVRQDSPFKTAQDYVAYARKNPGKLTHGSAGRAMMGTFAMHFFEDKVGMTVTQVPYQGAAPSYQGLASGDVDSVYGDVATALPFVTSGRFRILAVSTSQRLSQLPDVPTLNEMGMGEISHPPIWFGFIAPPGVPAHIAEALNEKITAIVRKNEIDAFLKQQILVPRVGSAAQMAEAIAQDRAVWPPLVRKLNISVE